MKIEELQALGLKNILNDLKWVEQQAIYPHPEERSLPAILGKNLIR
ncbi:MAG: hypothetical protein ACFFBD_23655 [Candidatus Hodarchaeota archaeon]